MNSLFLFLLIFGTVTAEEFYNTDKCGKSMGCWLFPNGCKNEDCHAIVRWKVKKNLLRVELQVTNFCLLSSLPNLVEAKDLEETSDGGRYMALGFSEDKFMDNDTVTECVFDSKGKAKAFISYNDHKNNVQLDDVSSTF
jgi:hypothetical protein